MGMNAGLDESRWPLLVPHLPRSFGPETMRQLEAKFRSGEKKHGVGGWETWPVERFLFEMADVWTEMVLYGAMREVAAEIRAAMPLNANDMARRVRAAKENTRG